jgi:hypothetical protein
MGRHDPAKFRRELERRSASGAAKAGKARDRADEARPSRAASALCCADVSSLSAQALRRELLLCASAVEARCAKRRRLDGPGAHAAAQDAPEDAPSAAGGDEAQPQPVRGCVLTSCAALLRQLCGFKAFRDGGKRLPRASRANH